ncbi:heavy metal translocating P-type ATPase [Mediterraneibacter sp. ICN-202921]|uniref:heavy metal translocating P-type ATPase n=1 Tax=Mediterraneibacter sp. ICN-202921 TaxID=3134657 RepID=UPI0030C35BDA
MGKDVKRKWWEIGIGTILYVTVFCTGQYQSQERIVQCILYLIPYGIISFETYWEMLKGLRRFQFFNEKLLMIFATIGAFCIGRNAEAAGAMLFFEIGVLIEKIAFGQTKKSIAKFMDIRPDSANLKTDSGEEAVSPEQLSVGDVIIIKPGDKIPVDAVVTFGNSTIDKKALTGEYEPVEVKPGDRLYSGSINLSGGLEAKVKKLYKDSTASRIVDLVENANNKKADTENLVVRFTKYYTPAVLLLGILVMILPPMMLSGQEPDTWIYRGLIFLVAACPSGLLISVPLAFLGGIGAASRQGILIKGCDHVEALSQTETFVFDKTGTLTEGVFHVYEIEPKNMEKEALLDIASAAEAYSTHPIAVSLRESRKEEIDLERVEEVREFSGFGIKAKVDGKEVIVGNYKFLMKEGIFFAPPNQKRGTAVYVAEEGEYAGCIIIDDVIRPDVKRLMRWLHRHNIEAVMLTGDNVETAQAVARELHIDYVYADLLPEDKVEQLEEFIESQMESEKLAFVGDGINDAPVLARADIGIAMGGLGADAALEAADVILMEDEPSKIINAIRISQGTLHSVKENMIFALGMKLFLLLLAFFGLVTMQNAILADMGVMLLNILNSFWVIKYPE